MGAAKQWASARDRHSKDNRRGKRGRRSRYGRRSKRDQRHNGIGSVSNSEWPCFFEEGARVLKDILTSKGCPKGAGENKTQRPRAWLQLGSGRGGQHEQTGRAVFKWTVQ